MSKGFAIMRVSNCLIRELLGLPLDITVVGVRVNKQYPDDTSEIIIESERYPELPEGAEPPIVSPIMRVHTQRVAVVENESLNIKDGDNE